MPFDKIDKFETQALYNKTLKAELSHLDEEPHEFWYFDAIEIEGVECPVLVTGRFKAGVIKELRARSPKKGYGTCRLDKHTLLVDVQSGKAPLSGLKRVMTQISGFRVKVSDEV